MSDSREIEDNPPIGSDAWRLRMDEGAKELARIQHQTAETCKALNWAISKIFDRKTPPF